MLKTEVLERGFIFDLLGEERVEEYLDLRR